MKKLLICMLLCFTLCSSGCVLARSMVGSGVVFVIGKVAAKRAQIKQAENEKQSRSNISEETTK